MLLTFALNLLASPLLILGWFIPPLGLSLQIFLNAYLLGKEYGHLVEFRIPKDQPASPVPKYFVNGMIASCIWIIPVLNLLAPILLAGSVLHTRINLRKLRRLFFFWYLFRSRRLISFQYLKIMQTGNLPHISSG